MPTVAEWRERIDKGIEYRDRFGRAKEWERFASYYRGEWDERFSWLPVNMIFAIGRSLVPRLYFRNPRVVVTPLQPGRYLQARVLERVDNLIIREIGIKKALKAAALDAFLYGTGIVKRGYDSEYGFDPEQGTYESGALATATGESGGERIEYDSTIKPGWPWVKRIHPATFVVPWGTSELESAPWCAHMVIRHVEDVRKDPKYRRSVAREVEPTLTHVPTPQEPKFLYQRGARNEYVKLWEIYDAKTSKVIVIAEGLDKPLREDDDVLSTLGFPFHAVVFNPDHDHFWGISDVAILEPQQLELNEVRTQMRAHRRIALLKFLYKDGTMNQEELQKLFSGDFEDVGAGIRVTGDPGSAVSILQPHVPPDLVMVANEIRMDMRELSGFSRNQLGEFDKGTRRTATEAAIVQQAASIRVDERRDMLADVLADIIRGVNDTLFEYWTEEHVAQVVGPDGARYWLRFTGDDLRGEYTYRIDPDTALPTTAEKRKQEAIELYQALAQRQDINQQEVLRHLLLQYEGIDIEAVMQPQAVPPQAGGLMSVGELAGLLAQQQAMAQGALQPA